MSAFLLKVTTPNKQFFSAGSLILELDAPSSYYAGFRLFSDLEIVFILSLDNPLDFHSETYSRY